MIAPAKRIALTVTGASASASAWEATHAAPVLEMPVRIRYMRGTGHDVDVRRLLPEAALLAMLAGASSIWSAGGIRLVPGGVHTHTYALREWGYRDEHDQVPSPSSDFRLFRALNAAYGTPQIRAIDLFVAQPGESHWHAEQHVERARHDGERQRAGAPQVSRPLESVAERLHTAERFRRNAIRKRAEAEKREQRDRRHREIAAGKPRSAARAIEDRRLRPGGHREARQNQRTHPRESKPASLAS